MTANSLVLITGGSRGLGRSAALTLADHGHDVIITYLRNVDEATAVVSEIAAKGRKAAALQLDTGNISTFPDFVQTLARALKGEWGRDSFDALVNNAGVGIHKSFAETDEASFDTLMNIHFKGVFFLTQKLLPLIADGGRILNVSSGLARFSLPGMAAYASMKGAIEVLTRYLAAELGPRRISVNVIAPGAIETDFGGGRVRDDAATNAQIAGNTALGRVGVPEDIGGAMAMLLAPESRWINGQRIEVSGGIYL
jgi:NAD(P)-dependent dehydrogenase (short-subunit alcohol dehydrogenase family)